MLLKPFIDLGNSSSGGTLTDNYFCISEKLFSELCLLDDIFLTLAMIACFNPFRSFDLVTAALVSIVDMDVDSLEKADFRSTPFDPKYPFLFNFVHSRLDKNDESPDLP